LRQQNHQPAALCLCLEDAANSPHQRLPVLRSAAWYIRCYTSASAVRYLIERKNPCFRGKQLEGPNDDAECFAPALHLGKHAYNLTNTLAEDLRHQTIPTPFGGRQGLFRFARFVLCQLLGLLAYFRFSFARTRWRCLWRISSTAF
jgi:hypothetical protein